MKRPTWDDFTGKNANDKTGAFEALARMLFRTKYGLGDSLPYFKNHAGNETCTIQNENEIVGFQSKFFENEIDASQLIHSIEAAGIRNPNQTKIIIYTNKEFGNPRNIKEDLAKGIVKTQTNAQKSILDTAKKYNLTVEWMFGDNILDAVQGNELCYNLFFNLNDNITRLHECVSKSNDQKLRRIDAGININGVVINIDRNEVVQQLEVLVSQHCDVLVTGKSGVGKSVVVKKYYEKYKDDDRYAFFIVSAAQLNTNKVNDLFHLQEDFTLKAAVDFYEDTEHKVLIIDSAEKFLELQDVPATMLLLDEMKSHNWSVVFTCKSSNETELMEMLVRNYNVNATPLNVSCLTEEELQNITKTYTIKLPTDRKLLDRLTVPFYFARYCEISNGTGLTIASFRETIWNLKVRGEIRGADQQKREECLLSLVQCQQGKHLYFVPYSEVDIDSAYKLAADDILEDLPHLGYSVKHDIYTDWALYYVIERCYASNSSLGAMLTNIEPTVSVKNVFATWLEDKMAIQDRRVKDFLPLIFDRNIDPKWVECIQTAVARTKGYAGMFFSNYRPALQEDDFYRFDKFVDVLCVTCQGIEQYITYKGTKYPILKPIGEGWDEAVKFIYNHKEDYYVGHLQSVFKLLNNYVNKRDKVKDVSRMAALLSLQIFYNVEKARINEKSFWFQEATPWCNLVCRFSYDIGEEFRDIFNKVIANGWVSHRDPYAELVEFILKKADNITIYPFCIICREEIIKLMDYFWREQRQDEEHGWGDHRYRNSEYAFGLNQNFAGINTYFPCSALQTPIYTLLKTEEIINIEGAPTLDFIIQFMDYVANTYKERGLANEEIELINVTLPDGRRHDVITSQSLWYMYRGTSGLSMPDMLESIHMALEKYLLESAEEQKNIEHVGALLDSILNKSHSASLWAVVASVVTAHPDVFFNQFLFLIQKVQFLELDLMRFTREFHAKGMASIAYYRHENLWEERSASNELKHRQTHLEKQLLLLQISYDNDTENKDRLTLLYRCVDNLKQQVAKMPKEYLSFEGYVIARIDYRSMKVEDVEIEKGVYAKQYTPHLSEEQKADNRKLEADTSEMMRGITLKYWVEKRMVGDMDAVKNSPFENNVQKVLTEIRNIEQQLKNKDKGLHLLMSDDIPYMTSALLLMQFGDRLNENEKNECQQRLLEALESPDLMLSSSMSGLSICLQAIPVLVKTLLGTDIDRLVRVILVYASTTHELSNNRPCDIVRTVISEYKLWESDESFMSRVLAECLASDLNKMDIDAARKILCILTPTSDDRELVNRCVRELSECWRPEEGNSHNCHSDRYIDSYMVADFILRAPHNEIPKLVAYYSRFLSGEERYESLIKAFLIECVSANLYDTFWIVWNGLYECMVLSTRYSYNATVMNDYLLNPSFLREQSTDWFRLEEKDLKFFERVATDRGSHPAVLHAMVNVFNGIGSPYLLQSIRIVASIIKRADLEVEDTISVVRFHLEKIMQRALSDYDQQLRRDAQFRQDVIDILEFLKNNDSTQASIMLNSL